LYATFSGGGLVKQLMLMSRQSSWKRRYQDSSSQ